MNGEGRPSRADTLLRARRFIQAAGQVPDAGDLSEAYAAEVKPVLRLLEGGG